MSKLLETIDLTTNFYTYEGVVKALQKVAVVIEKGTTFGLVGESGCGKSVTVRSIMQIVQEPGRIECGKILFNMGSDEEKETIDLLKQSEAFLEELRGDAISMIFQEPNAALNPILSIGEQVSESYLFHRQKEMHRKILLDRMENKKSKYGLFHGFFTMCHEIGARKPDAFFLKVSRKIPILNRWEKALKKEALLRSIEIIGKLGIPDPENVVKSFPHELSGGMKQRIVIAIALACSPVLLIADEATSNLDVTIQAQILDLLRSLKKTEISSVLLITHDLGVVAETCDRAGVMYAGSLCEVGDTDDLFMEPLHPYSMALLESVPRFRQEGKLKTIEGNVPNLVNPPPGCRFHPRCSFSTDICKHERPLLGSYKKNRMIACHNFRDLIQHSKTRCSSFS